MIPSLYISNYIDGSEEKSRSAATAAPSPAGKASACGIFIEDSRWRGVQGGRGVVG